MEIPTRRGVAQKKFSVLAFFHGNRRTVDFARLRKNADALSTSTCCLRKFKSYLNSEKNCPIEFRVDVFFFFGSRVRCCCNAMVWVNSWSNIAATAAVSLFKWKLFMCAVRCNSFATSIGELSFFGIAKTQKWLAPIPITIMGVVWSECEKKFKSYLSKDELIN